MKLPLGQKELLPEGEPVTARLPVWEMEAVKEEEPQLELVPLGL